jgi:N-acetylneuraminate lyase
MAALTRERLRVQSPSKERNQMIKSRMEGLIAAAVTPLQANGALRLEQVGPIVDRLIEQGVSGLYVCGSTGEGMSLTDDERRAVAEAYINAARGRIRVMIQVGHNSLASAVQLAAHAQRAGADALSATCPSYFTLSGLGELIDSMAEVAAGAPKLPFYYYHIPSLTGVNVDMIEFLRRAEHRIPTLAGLKYTLSTLNEFQLCQTYEDGRFDILWGVDEMLLGAVATGAKGAVGSTYNIAAAAYLEIVAAVNQGRLNDARKWQGRVSSMIRILASYPFHAALREVMKLLGTDCGPCRLPLRTLTPDEAVALRQSLDQIGFFDWSGNGVSEALLRADAAHGDVRAPSAAPNLKPLHRQERA